MSVLFRRIHGIFFSTSPLSSRIPLLSTRTCVSIAVEPPLTKHQEPATSCNSEVTTDSELRKMVEEFKLRCTDAPFRNSVYSYDNIVRRLTIAKRFSWIEEILEDQKQYMTFVSIEHFVRRIITLYGNAGMFDHARKLFDEMPQLGYDPPTVTSFNCLLEACVKCGHLDKIEEIFREIPPKLTITPNLISYTILIKAYSKMGSLDSILSTIREMEEKEIKPNSFIFAFLLDGLYKNGKVEEAEAVWNSMKSKGIVPCIRCYNSQLRFLASEKKMKEALELFEGLEGKGLKPNLHTFYVLFEGYRAEKNLEEAKNLYKKLSLKTKSIREKSRIFKILIPFATGMDDFEFAVDLCYMALKERIFLQHATLQGVLNGLVRESKVEMASELLNCFRRLSSIYCCDLINLPSEL